MTQLDDNLALALELSHRIIALGKSGKWDQVPDLDEQRLQLLQALFADDEMPSRRAELKTQLESLLSLNQEAVAICARARSDSLASSRAAKRGMQAISAYHKQSGGH